MRVVKTNKTKESPTKTSKTKEKTNHTIEQLMFSEKKVIE